MKQKTVYWNQEKTLISDCTQLGFIFQGLERSFQGLERKFDDSERSIQSHDIAGWLRKYFSSASDYKAYKSTLFY